ncbi:hypothetical protein EZS27_036988 [termite gut metagenome]|uniref:Uncharacterized protein n=1 Tax=termite gut metagenome TaxID=433724 RepID=A0A5J4PT57_9ZZZZ
MNNFIANYRNIVETLRTIESKENFLHQIRTPKLSNLELITMDLTAECMSIDSEYQLFRILPIHLSQRVECSVYNRRKCRLFSHIVIWIGWFPRFLCLYNKSLLIKYIEKWTKITKNCF